MHIAGNKQIIFITGSVWTGSRAAPRNLLLKDGFKRPTWFTTNRPITDAQYKIISETDFHLAQADARVLAYIQYAGGFLGILNEDFDHCLSTAERGVLIVGPPDFAAKIAAHIPQAKIFTFKDPQMDLSLHLDLANRQGQVQRIDIDILEPGAWTQAYESILSSLGIQKNNAWR